MGRSIKFEVHSRSSFSEAVARDRLQWVESTRLLPGIRRTQRNPSEGREIQRRYVPSSRCRRTHAA